MPNPWEIENGLDTANAADRNNVGADGYTMLENYLNSIAGYTPVSVSGLTFSSAQDSVEKNEEKQLHLIFTPFDATNQIVTWSSSDSSVAIASGSGLVQGIDTGTAVITATSKDGGFVAECTVEVFAVSVTGVAVSLSELNLDVGRAKRLTATVEPSNATEKDVSWESSDEDVATVSTTGYVRAISVGSAAITVTTEDGMFTDTCKVEVSDVSSIKQTESLPDIHIYPNPFTDKITIEFAGLDNIAGLEILNITGQAVRKLDRDELETGSIELDLDIPGNLFLLRIDTEEKVYTKKIIRK
jgi:uncharacterized protein YjdB